MPAFSAISAIAGVLGVYQSYKGSKEARRARRRAEEAEALETAEEVRRAEAEAERTEALARARAAASGVGGVTPDIYLAALEEESQLEIDWLRQAGISAVEAARARGEAAEGRATSGIWSGLAGLGETGASIWGTYGPRPAPTT